MAGSSSSTHRFGVQLVSVLRQNLLHAGLFCVCYKPKPPENREENIYKLCETTKKNKNANSLHLKNKSHKAKKKAWQSVRHPVIGRRSAHASFLPRPLGNGIPHHHTLLHLAKFTEVLLQALCGRQQGNWGGVKTVVKHISKQR